MKYTAITIGILGIGVLVILAMSVWHTSDTTPDTRLGYTTDLSATQEVNDEADLYQASVSEETAVTTSAALATTTTINQPEVSTAAMPQVTIETTKGTIVVELFKSDAPNTVENFLKLTRDEFYDGVLFHRVIPGFMIQGGDPEGTGRGGPGYRFDDELNPATASYQRGYVRGTLAMANAGPNTNGSQFFIMHEDYPLPNAYTIFGRVIEGIEVVDAIAAVETTPSDRPIEDVIMQTVRVTE